MYYIVYCNMHGITHQLTEISIVITMLCFVRGGGGIWPFSDNNTEVFLTNF